LKSETEDMITKKNNQNKNLENTESEKKLEKNSMHLKRESQVNKNS